MTGFAQKAMSLSNHHSFGRNALMAATAVAGAGLFIAAPEIGIAAAAAGLAMGMVSAGIALSGSKSSKIERHSAGKEKESVEDCFIGKY